MKKLYQITSVLSLLIIVAPFIINHVEPYLKEAFGINSKEEADQKIPLRDQMELAWQQEFDLTHDPALGIVPKERLYDAWKYQQSLFEKKGMGKSAIPGVSWQERGPNNWGGRTRALVVDLNDATRKTVWIGGVCGGLWKTTDITQANPTWTVIDDFFQNLAITGLEQAPSNPQIMYFCTGEGSGNSDAVRGLGVWKSSNGGGSWTQLSATNNSSFYYCQKVFALGNGDTVFVATKTGLYRTLNAGTSFTKVLGTGISSAGGNNAYDIERMYNGTLYATMSSGGATSGTIHKSFDRGATWTNPLTVPAYVSKNIIELGIANNDTNVVYGLVESGGRIRCIIKSNNAGLTFDTVAAHPVDADNGVSAPGANIKDFSRGQAWYDLSIAVDPNNSSVCTVGGIDLFKTSNGGASWVQISHWYGGFGFQDVHADQHYAFFAPGNSNVCYFTNDGGVFMSTNFTNASPTISSKNSSYNTLQFYACDINPNGGSNQYIAGAQDNGSHSFSTAGINSTNEVTGGDGAFCHIDQDQPLYWFTSYVYTSYYRSTNGGTSFSNVLNTSGNVGSFISPTDYDDNANKMYMCGNNGTFLRWDNPQTGTSLVYDTILGFNGGKVTHVKVSPNTNNRVFFGTNGGRVLRVDNANLATPLDSVLTNGKGMPTGSVSCIEVETGNDNHLLATYSNYGVASVWESKNGGFTWTNVEGNLPDMPVRWALFNPNKNWQVMLATELGVWTTDTLRGALTDWQPSNSGFANVRTDMLKMRAFDKQVVAATHGRGLFTTNVFAPPFADFTSNKTLTYVSAFVNFTSTSNGATSYSWDFGDGTFSTAQNPVKQYMAPGVYNVTLSINGGFYSKMVNNYIQILPYRPVPYTLALGGNFESNPNDFGPSTISGVGFVRGSSVVAAKSGTASGANAWVTGLSGNYADNNNACLYSPNFNCTASGTYTLRFKVKNSFEVGYDGYIVEYSLNLGNTWTKLGNAVLINWYDFANTTNTTAFPINEPYFNATRSSYTQMQYNISPLAGNNKVCFRFVFKSDGGVTAAGMAIDDFEILGPNNSSLPAVLIHFSAKRLNQEQVEINWSTASELNNKGFELQRSIDGFDFDRLSFLPGKINSQTTQNYAYNDLNAKQDHLYYRLKQVDMNGSFQYSPIIFVSSNPLREKLAEINHILGSKSLFIEANQAELSLRILNQEGKELQQIKLKEAINKLDFNELSSGVYLLELSDNKGNIQVEKVLFFN